ncbi:hypothetical protein CPB86DRAFT_455072 [Serendipita vermifera]|nr:hypothetical protein CPB86DRAFT_455072 [Serendipita vermifera]
MQEWDAPLNETKQGAQGKSTNIVNKQKNGSRKRKKVELNPEKEHEDAMRRYSKRFAFAQTLWPGCTAPDVAVATLPEDYSPMDRFAKSPQEDTERKLLRSARGVLWEVEQSLPPELRPEEHETIGFYRKMFGYMTEFRSAFQNSLRKHGGLLLLPGHEVTNDDLTDLRDPQLRQNNQKFQSLLAFNGSAESQLRCPLLPPIIKDANIDNGPLGGAFQTPIIRRACILPILPFRWCSAKLFSDFDLDTIRSWTT